MRTSTERAQQGKPVTLDAVFGMALAALPLLLAVLVSGADNSFSRSFVISASAVQLVGYFVLHQIMVRAGMRERLAAQLRLLLLVCCPVLAVLAVVVKLLSFDGLAAGIIVGIVLGVAGVCVFSRVLASGVDFESDNYLRFCWIALLVSGVFACALVYLPSWASVAVAVVLCAAEVVVVLRRQSEVPARFDADLAQEFSYDKLLRMAFCMGLMGYALGIVIAFIAHADKGLDILPAWFAIVWVVSIATLLVASRIYGQRGFYHLPQWSLFAIMASLAIVAAISSGYLRMVAFGLMVANYLLSAFTITYLTIRSAQDEGVSVLWSTAFVRACGAAGILVGAAIWIVAQVFVSGETLLSAACVSASIVVIIYFVVMFRKTYDKVRVPAQQAAQPDTEASSDNAGEPDASTEDDRSWEWACAAVCERYGLSPREREVFDYLSRGRTAKHIEQSLFIAKTTVKSHISHIYSKLGIHSQQELIDIVEEQLQSGSPKQGNLLQ